MTNLHLPAPFIVAGSIMEFPIPENLLPFTITQVIGGDIQKNGMFINLPGDLPITFEAGELLKVIPFSGTPMQVIGHKADYLTPVNLLSLLDEAGEVQPSESGGKVTFTVPELLTGKLRMPPGTPAFYGLRSNPAGELIPYPLAPVGLYDSGGFLTAPSGLNEDQAPGSWGLRSDQFTTADQDVLYGGTISQFGTFRMDTSHQANSEWYVEFMNRTDLIIEKIAVWFNCSNDATKTALFELAIMDGATVVAAQTVDIGNIANNTHSPIDFDFLGLPVFPKDAQLRLKRISGDIQVIPSFYSYGGTFQNQNLITDTLVRNAAGVVYTAPYAPAGISLPMAFKNIGDRIEPEAVVVDDTSTYDVTGMHLTRLDVPTSNPVGGVVTQHCIIELTALPHLHPNVLEGVAFGVQQNRMQTGARTFFGLLRDHTGTLKLQTGIGAGNQTPTGDLGALATGVKYRFEFTLTSNAVQSTLTFKGAWRSSDGQQMASQSTHTFPPSENPLFALLAGGEGGLLIRKEFDLARPLPVRIHRWVEWRTTP